MTQRQLGTHSRVSAASVSRLERGKADISVEAFVRIAHALNVDPVKLLRRVARDIAGRRKRHPV